MKLFALLLPIALFFLNVQTSQASSFVLPSDAEDGDSTALADLVNNIICYILPCNDESLAWGNILGAGSPSGAPLGASATTVDEAPSETPLRDSLQDAARNMFFDFMITQMTNQMTNNNNGGNRMLRGARINEKKASDFAEALAEKEATSL